MHIPFHRSFALLLFMLGMSPSAFADEAADRAALETAAQAWTKAFNSRDADTLVALTTEDVVLLDPALPPVSGRNAARGALQKAFAAVQGQVRTATKEIVITGDVAWRIGALTRKLPPNSFAPAPGQSLEIWKRVNGQWKMHRQMSWSLLAQPPLTAPPPSDPMPDPPVN
jgi:ketosteroid isomerase-like protein